jgi:hypothetical protein
MMSVRAAVSQAAELHVGVFQKQMQCFCRPHTPVRSLFVAALAVASFSGAAWGDSFYASYLAPGVTTPLGITSNYETFDTITPGSNPSSFATNFNGSSYTGTYTGAGLQWLGANQYGGAGGTGTYPEIFTSIGYTLTLDKSANYFGLWFSALDAGNLLQFYNNSTLVYSFTPADFIKLVGNCPGGKFCGNPNPGFLNADSSQQFAYLNFYDQTGTFNKIVFSEVSGAAGGFESDNHAVATLSGPPGGTQITTVPEPAALSLAGLLLIGIYAGRKRRFPNT